VERYSTCLHEIDPPESIKQGFSWILNFTSYLHEIDPPESIKSGLVAFFHSFWLPLNTVVL